MSSGKGMRSHDTTDDPGPHGCFLSRPLLGIDRHGLIDWAYAAHGETAKGRRCWEVLGCGALSREQCKGVQYPNRGTQARHPSESPAAGAVASDVCLIFSVPPPFRGLLVWGPESRGRIEPAAMLQVVAGLAGPILSHDLINGAEAAITLFLIATEADSCELFLADLWGKELFAVASVGAGQPTAVQRIPFDAAAAGSRPVFVQGQATIARSTGPRPRRRDAAQSEGHSFISISIPAPDGRTLGCLNLSWHRNGIAVETLAEALTSTARPLGNAICAAYWSLRERIGRACGGGSGRQSLVSMLQMLHESAGADAGSLVMWDKRNLKVQRTSFFGAAAPNCPWLASPQASPCASRDSDSSFRLMALTKPEDAWPTACRQMRFDGLTVFCIPVLGQSDQSGRILLGYRRNPRASPMHMLVPLQIMAEEIGLHLQAPPEVPETLLREAMPARLQIRCFGHFEVTLGGRALPPSAFPRRDALVLLKMLVLRAGKQVHRERLIEWLWPGVGEAAGVNRLHGVVHALRSVIEPNVAERRWKYLLNDGDTYSFCPGDSASVDLISFRQYLALARRDQSNAAIAPNVAHYLEQAVEIYRGELFEDDPCPDWCDVERIALQRDFVDALANLARIYRTLGETKHAINALRRALSRDPSLEDLQHELIQCLVQLGRHKEAKEQVSDCVRFLRDDLGVEPTQETMRLYRSIVAHAQRV